MTESSTLSALQHAWARADEKTRIKVQDAILQTGYAPNTLAQSFRRGRTNGRRHLFSRCKGVRRNGKTEHRSQSLL